MPRFHNINGVRVQFTAEEETARDVEEQRRTDKDAAIVARQPLTDWVSLRAERNTKLTESDWTQYNDSPLSDEVKAEWAVHRETLRDLPANTDDPADPTWPTPPG